MGTSQWARLSFFFVAQREERGMIYWPAVVMSAVPSDRRAALAVGVLRADALV